MPDRRRPTSAWRSSANVHSASSTTLSPITRPIFAVKARRDRVLRDYVIEFLTMLAPHLRARDLQRIVQSGYRPAQALAPTWEMLREPLAGVSQPAARRVLIGG